MKLNLETTTHQAFTGIYELDKKWVGTSNYQGLAYFWNHEYRHYLRGQTPHILKRVHNKFIKENLPLNGESDKHLQIIRDITKLF